MTPQATTALSVLDCKTTTEYSAPAPSAIARLPWAIPFPSMETRIGGNCPPVTDDWLASPQRPGTICQGYSPAFAPLIDMLARVACGTPRAGVWVRLSARAESD